MKKKEFKFEHYFDLLYFWKCLQINVRMKYVFKKKAFFILTSISQQSHIQKIQIGFEQKSNF